MAGSGAPLAFLGLVIPDVYLRAVERGRSLVLISGFYRRPQERVSWTEQANGSKLVRPASLRPVAESQCPAAHVAEACRLRMIQPEFDVKAPADLVAAVNKCVEMRGGRALSLWRDRQLKELHAIEASLAEWYSRPGGEYPAT